MADDLNQPNKQPKRLAVDTRAGWVAAPYRQADLMNLDEAHLIMGRSEGASSVLRRASNCDRSPPMTHG